MSLADNYMQSIDIHNSYLLWLYNNGYRTEAFDYICTYNHLSYRYFYDNLNIMDIIMLIKYDKKIAINLLDNGRYSDNYSIAYHIIIDIYPDIVAEYVELIVYIISSYNADIFIYLYKILDIIPNNLFEISILNSIYKDDLELIHFINSHINYPNDTYKDAIDKLCIGDIEIEEYMLLDTFFLEWFKFLRIDLSEYVLKYNLQSLIDANNFELFIISQNIAIQLNSEDLIINNLIQNRMDNKLIEIINKGFGIGNKIKDTSLNVCKNIPHKNLYPIIETIDDLQMSLFKGLLDKKIPDDEYGQKFVELGFTLDDLLNIKTFNDFNLITSLLRK